MDSGSTAEFHKTCGWCARPAVLATIEGSTSTKVFMSAITTSPVLARRGISDAVTPAQTQPTTVPVALSQADRAELETKIMTISGQLKEIGDFMGQLNEVIKDLIKKDPKVLNEVEAYRQENLLSVASGIASKDLPKLSKAAEDVLEAQDLIQEMQQVADATQQELHLLRAQLQAAPRPLAAGGSPVLLPSNGLAAGNAETSAASAQPFALPPGGFEPINTLSSIVKVWDERRVRFHLPPSDSKE